MDVRPKTRPVNRRRNAPTPQPPRGAKQIVIPMTRSQYDELWHDARRVRAFLAEWVGVAPELFPAGFDRGYHLHGRVALVACPPVLRVDGVLHERPALSGRATRATRRQWMNTGERATRATRWP